MLFTDLVKKHTKEFKKQIAKGYTESHGSGWNIWAILQEVESLIIKGKVNNNTYKDLCKFGDYYIISYHCTDTGEYERIKYGMHDNVLVCNTRIIVCEQNKFKDDDYITNITDIDHLISFFNIMYKKKGQKKLKKYVKKLYGNKKDFLPGYYQINFTWTLKNNVTNIDLLINIFDNLYESDGLKYLQKYVKSRYKMKVK